MHGYAIRRTFPANALCAALLAALLLTLLGIPGTAQAAPVTLTNATQFKDPQGEPVHAHGGGVVQVGGYYYWFGENRNADNTFRYVSAYRSKDLKTWEFRKHVLTQATDPELASANIERPKVMFNKATGKFVMWMHKENAGDYGEARAAVAVVDTVDGDYTWKRSFRPLGHMSRDITTFVDTDGTGYMISAANENRDLHVYRLTADYTDIESQVQKLWAGQSREAPAMFVRDGVYFLLTSGATGWSPNQQKYGTATSVTGEWSGLTDIGDDTTYGSQTAYVLPVQGSKGTSYLYLGDRWGNSIGGTVNDSQYVWAPLAFPTRTTMTMDFYPELTIDAAAGTVSGAGDWQPLSAAHSGKCADVADRSTAEGAAVVQWTCGNRSFNQEFWLKGLSGGQSQIVARNSGKCLTPKDGSTADGAEIVQRTCDGGAAQRWTASASGDGIKLVNRDKCLDVLNQSRTDGAPLVQWTCNAGTNQQWRRGTPQTLPDARTVHLDPSYQQAPFQGWGTALAWFANVTGGWPDAQRKRLADALYGADGLGFTVARYNIGGGDSPETPPYMRAGGAVPGLWKRPGAETPNWWNPANPAHWNVTADANQQWWLKAAKARGATTFEAFSNSAPYFMTRSGKVSGANVAGEDNLRPDQYANFAAYLSGAVQRVQKATGVTFGSLSPVNEPNTDYWKAGGRQEGSHWDPASQARMITTLRSTLNAQGLRTPIAAMDETNPNTFRKNWDSYASGVRDAVGQLNAHTYGTGGRTGVRDIAKGEATRLWMSEVDLGGSVPQSFTDMSPAFDLTRRINDDIRELEPSAWVLWQAVEDYENMTPGRENSNWGLVQTDFTPDNAATEPLRKNKKYWAMANYSRFVRPGARVITTDDADTFAALRPSGTGTVVVHTNTTDKARNISLDLSGFGKVGTGAVQRHVTDGTRDLQRDTDLKLTGTTLKATVAPGSVTTFVLPQATGVNPRAATTPTGAPRRIVNDHSKLALSAVTADGTTAPVQRAVNPADTAQQWTFTPAAPGDWSHTAAYRITNTKTGRALSASGDTLSLATPNGSTAQQWMRSTTGDGHTTLVNRATGKLLDVMDEATHDGAAVGVYRPTTGSNQSWTLPGATG